ncbi:MAG: DUF971 domain-containing protein [Pseudomonadota bacterium]
MSRHHPTNLTLHTTTRTLEVSFDDGVTYTLPCEYLRVFSPSAEVRGHGLPEPLLVTGKRSVNITAIEPVGQYAVKLIFDDGHDSGLYDWDFLYALGQEHDAHWARYLERLEAAGKTRDA